MQRESEKEWYYGNADKERLGPYSFEEVTRSAGLLSSVSWIYVYSSFTRLHAESDLQCSDTVGWATGRASGL